MANTQTRDCIIAEADQLFYEQGFEHTTFSQIAEAVGISRGNFYYHFKTKDEILDSVINRRLARTRSMLEEWEVQGDSPGDRIRSFINILIMNRAKIKRYGCPVGTLCSELAKLEHPAKSNANELFTLFRAWLRRQFELLGRHGDADQLAMHLLAASQGVATLASAFQDEEFISSEVGRLNEWLISLERHRNAKSEVS
ncbi:TetR/AcrR family transcriptional regulator [Halomonas salipaludis]|uniref:TetR family transcriptional regulator n=1 Tax=Halomonas salipaludis TaxID=2032625 RepID=A0A2A2EVT0_9GAMM|nr:TetR/AcrR family transcriptional regulator [Halomonas salipaludis]PAU76515.1 TetR family transcriptional regulator [Halomonas salipaludis]